MKERTKRFWKELSRALTVYALMPLVCLGCLATVMVFAGEQVEDVECLAVEYSARELAARLAILSQWPTEHNDESGAYFFQVPQESPLGQPSTSEDPLKVTLNVPQGMKPIVKKDLSSSSLFINTTDFSLDAALLREQSRLVPLSGDQPLVLVVHTHTTEAYAAGSSDTLFVDPSGYADGYYDPNGDSPRSEDPDQSVVAVGAEFCRTLEEMGVPALHCTVRHDAQFNQSYTRSYETVKALLKQYPSIAYVVDIHRDSIVKDNGEKIKAYTQIEGRPCAQVMLVVGTDESGYSHPDWRVNMGNALLFYDTMQDLYPGLSRSIYVRDVRFNQHLSTGAMLLEVGTCGNTLPEALNAAHFSAKALATLLHSVE